MLLLAVCVQSNIAKLEQYCDSSYNEAGACTVKVADVVDAIKCASSKDQRTAEKFCEFLWNIAYYAYSQGCDVILQAGGIPVLFDCIRAWPRERNVVWYACCASYFLALNGSITVKSAMRSVPGCEARLIAAHKSKLAKFGHSSYATMALVALGYKKPGCTIM